MKCSKRIKWLDFGKGFAIFCVVASHAFQFTSKNSLPLIVAFLNVFMMAIFFSISGYLYKPIHTKRDYLKLIYKKISGFLIPYVLFSIIIYIFYKLNLATTWEGKPYYNNIWSVIFCLQNSYIWFLYMLFAIFIIIGSINLMFDDVKFYVKLLLIVILVAIFLSFKLLYFNGIKPLFLWMICFILGYFLRDHVKFIYKINKNVCYLIIITWMLLWLILYQLETNSLIYHIINHIFTISSIIICFMAFNILKDSSIFNYLCKYGQYTLVIYLIQQPIVLLLVNIIPIHNTIIAICILIITWILCTLFCKLVLRYKGVVCIVLPKEIY